MSVLRAAQREPLSRTNWSAMRTLFTFIAIGLVSLCARAQDWLVDPTPYKARIQVLAEGKELLLGNGLIQRRMVLAPNAATVEFRNLTSGQSILRGIKPEASVQIDGRTYAVGGLTGQPNYAFLDPAWIPNLKNDPGAFQYEGYEIREKLSERMAWKPTRRHAPDAVWPPKGIELILRFAMPSAANEQRVRVDVHYELYDGLPAYSKWITVDNRTEKTIKIDRYASDLLAAVEHTSEVDTLSVGLTPPNLHIETEMAFGGMTSQGANRRSYRWLADPEYHTQVNYEKKTPCLLEVGPDLGPSQSIEPGKQWSSYRAWVLVHDTFDRERCGLAVRKLFRCIAPWVTENPLMMHLIASDDASVMRAIDQCHEVGFEMLILSFGSGFNLENSSPSTIEKARRFAEAAKAKNIEIGSYSLLASRSVGAKDDVVMRDGQKPTFGNSPCLESQWGKGYFARLYEFHRSSGFTLLEHDGSYPGDPCASDKHPGHGGYEDSRWNQWETIAEFYRWCRAEGLYLNVPDHYFLVGSNKTGMGYREVNWSLPREQQTIHTRQNIYDGTWQKTPSMGWMFVPLTEYHGGGPAATIEPLDRNIDHYRNMLQSNLALGVQACYRGPRLYDTERVKQMVSQQVAWYKRHREILESDIIHGRRPDAMSLDWYLHANAGLKVPGMLVVFNPTNKELREKLTIPVHYTGLTDSAQIRQSYIEEDKQSSWQQVPISRQETIDWEVVVPAYSMCAYELAHPSGL